MLVQIKTQVIMYASIQEAVVNYVLFSLRKEKEVVKRLLFQERLIKISIPEIKKKKLKDELMHGGEEIVPCYYSRKAVDQTKIRFDQKLNALFELNLISKIMKNDLINLYKYRNTVHLEAEMKKNLTYDQWVNLLLGELRA